jgi:hypothetical protein
METYNSDPTTTRSSEPTPDRHRTGRFMGGLIVVIVGAVLLARNSGVHFPYWLFSFKMLLIVLGVYLGFRHSFKGFGWLVPILIGGMLLLHDFFPYWEIREYFWPLLIIGVGLYIMLRPSRKGNDPYWKKWQSDNMSNLSSDDYLDSTVIFGSVKKTIISKTFKGGDTVTIFGGTEINLNQADVEGRIVLDMTQVFAGTKLIVPPHWKIQSEDLVAIFGGIEDKRAIMSDPSQVNDQKVLVLKGTCIFGGIDIKSF